MSAPRVSFEIFPPKNVKASFKLWECMARLSAFEPDFISVTHGPQGSALTRDTAMAVREQTELPIAGHLTAARASKAEVLARADQLAEAGIRDIVALRGDPETPGSAFDAHADGFRDSVELVEALAKTGKFNIRVGAYPEAHPCSTSWQQNIDFLKAKFDAGANEAITQFFFEADTFLRFRDACADAGITAPIIPGILPIANWKKLQSFAERCGASLPSWLEDAFAKAVRDNRQDLLSIAVTSELCSDLMEEGVDRFHIYTLNMPHLTERLCLALGLTPKRVDLRNVA